MARAVSIASCRTSPDPIVDINITPLIDVMLVLLIMIIMTIPIAAHKVPVDLPQGRGGAPQLETPHRLDLTREGRLLWDGKAIPDAALPGLLAQVKDETLAMRTDPETRYERFDTVLATIKRAGVTRLGFLDHQPLAD